MPFRTDLRSLVATLAVGGGIWLGAGAAGAQTPAAALPTAPGAERAVTMAAPTAAKASLPGDNGSPLEPYLFTFILAGGGAIAAISVWLADDGVRRDYARFAPDARRRLMRVS